MPEAQGVLFTITTGHARRTDPDTSHAAARSLTDKAAMMRRLLVVYAAAPMTAEEATEAAGFGPEDGAWKRISDLARLGLIEDTPVRRYAHTGRPQVVRAITRAGRDVLGKP